jgi:hypothetical protein
MANDPTLTALAQQLACYERLAKLAQLQHEHVQNSRTEELLLVLGQRQELLDQVADLEQCIGPAKKRWAEYLASLGAEDRARAESMLEETRALLEDITTADRNDSLVLQQRKINLGQQINQATSARKFNRSYATAAYGQRPAALDLQR